MEASSWNQKKCSPRVSFGPGGRVAEPHLRSNNSNKGSPFPEARVREGMTRWIRYLVPFGMIVAIILLVVDLFFLGRMFAEIKEERLRAGMESLLSRGEPGAAIQHSVLPYSVDGSRSGISEKNGTMEISPEMVAPIEAIRKDREKGEVLSRAFEGSRGIVLVRLVWPTASQTTAAAIVENRSGFTGGFLKELSVGDGEIARAAERALYRVKIAGGPFEVFRDEAYRLSLARCENLLKERDDQIEEAESGSVSSESAALFRRRKDLRQAVVEERVRLRRLALADTDLRLPILKSIRGKEKELQSLPVPEGSVTGSALRSFVWERMAEVLVSEKVLRGDDPIVVGNANETDGKPGKALSYDSLRHWFFSAAVGSKLEVRRRSLELFASTYRSGLHTSASQVVREGNPAIGVWTAPSVPRVDSPLQKIYLTKLYLYSVLLVLSLIGVIALEIARRRAGRIRDSDR